MVGGPVQADRGCYVERDADFALEQAIRDQHFCYVLAPRATGKTSLMARTVRALRSEGQLAAVVDLTQIGARSESADAGRWYYSIAYRILRELRLKVDLQSWWQEKSTLMSEQRLAEFFWDLVLSNTTEPVTVCFDEIERVLELSFADQLFAAIRTCYARRATEPDYARLNFVVLGVANTTELCPDASLSPFSEGVAIQLPDFTLEQTYALEAGLGHNHDHARAVLQSIYGWAGGQPYLTQKLARGTVRRGGQLEHVEVAVRERFLARGTIREEPLLSHVRAMLTRRGPHNRYALMLLLRIARRLPVQDEPGSRSRMALKLSGVVTADRDGRLDYSNRIFRRVFNIRWIRSVQPFNWRSAGLAAAAAVLLVLISVWYTQYLPQPHIQALAAAAGLTEAEEAHRRIRRLPGYGRLADEMLEAKLTTWAMQSQSVADLFAYTDVLRELPSRAAMADRLMGQFWLQRAREEMRAEHRDRALVYATEALPGGEPEARQLVAELIGTDFPHLRRTLHLPAATSRWEADWPRDALTLVDAGARVQRVALHTGADAAQVTSSAPAPAAAAYSALQQVPLRRELSIDESGPAGAIELSVAIDHPDPGELRLQLEAPDGSVAPLSLDAGDHEPPGHYLFSSDAVSALATLTQRERQGVWRLTVADRRAGQTGSLAGWALRFAPGDTVVQDVPDAPLDIPDPQRTELVDLTLDAQGAVVAARPVRPGIVGSIALWHVVDGTLLADIEVETLPDRLLFAADGTRLVAIGGRDVRIWEVDGGREIARFEFSRGHALPPAVSADGAYLMVAERSASGPPSFTLLRADTGVSVAAFVGFADIDQWVLGAQARYLALLGPGRSVRVVDPRRRDMLTELRHDHDVARIVAIAGGERVVTVDDGGLVHAWSLADRSPDGVPRKLLGTTSDPASMAVARSQPVIAFASPDGYVVVRDLERLYQSTALRVERSGVPLTIRLAADGSQLLTGRGNRVRLWQLPERPTETVAEADELTALALDEHGRFASLGFRDGTVRVRSASALERAPMAEPPVDYIGHRGAVTSLAVRTEHSLVVSGGTDGNVRVWDLASVAPAPQLMRHRSGPIHAVAIASDGERVAGAADGSVRVWRIADAVVTAEIPVNGAAVGVAFAPDAAVLAIGDSAGNVYIGEPGGAMAIRSARAQGAVRALAFTPDGRWLVSGDDAGSVQLWDALTLEPIGQPYSFLHPVRWLRFTPDGLTLLVQTDHWMHRVATSGAQLQVLESRMMAPGVEAGAAPLTADGMRVRLISGRTSGRIALHEVAMERPAALSADFEPALLERDWAAALGLTIGPMGAIRVDGVR